LRFITFYYVTCTLMRRFLTFVYYYYYLFMFISTLQSELCPLCCEELDLSDREFYPCKCGYQVCMWCWHRIRESESGLCPACRTPYGEDPHQFSAVDVEDVLKENKAKEAAKKERQRVDGEPIVEVPKDRTMLANMRVIRRNLVYAVGLPPHIATEEILKKAEYFGQYGKISKIVINRTQATGDPRRASASAYVTFAHKEDTLANILALDGFYLENRNIRASYGTSKYCSAFIKNVRCNNPECTYLHEMGAAEDTFTKQEIQAGYVTSGRDVLARQQQIVAEQLRLGTLGVPPPRKKLGGGGPSGTGRASLNPVFPIPEYEEPSKPSPMVPPPAGVSRSVTASVTLNPANISAKLGRSELGGHGRSASTGTASTSKSSPVLTALPAPTATAVRKTQTLAPSAAAATTAASVVASGRSKSEIPDSHTTLTPLTPLKPKKSASTTRPVAGEPAPVRATNGAAKKKGLIGGDVIAVPTTAPASYAFEDAAPSSALGSLGGEVYSSALGGEVYTGQLHGGSSAIGSHDKWANTPHGGASLNTGVGAALSTGAMLGGSNVGGLLWDSGSNNNNNNNNTNMAVGGSVISRGPAPNSTSALASILGINLPTGSGSLQEQTLWTGPSPSGPSALSSLNESSVQEIRNVSGSSLIGGVPLGPPAAKSSGPGTIGGGGGNRSDIALLQSLLPGVHITSGNESIGYGGYNGAAAPGPNHRGLSGLNGDAIVGNLNSGGLTGSSSAVGAIGQNNQRRAGPGIW
jgi:CCR4-NOT transcription complex subunit 4